MRRSVPLWCSVCADLIHLASAKWHRINRTADWLAGCKRSASGKGQLGDLLRQRTAAEPVPAKFEEQHEVKSRPRRDKRWGIPGLNADARSTSVIEGGNGEEVRKLQYRFVAGGAFRAARAGIAGGSGVDALAFTPQCALSRRSHVCGFHQHG